jgi:hypothetical protein
MSSAQSDPAGWYPNPDVGGTRYWDGRRWTGDARPPRKPFAAASAHKGWGITLLIVGGLMVLASPANLTVRTTVNSDGEAVTSGGPGSFVIAIVVGLGLAAWGLYLFRGQGPRTKVVATKAEVANAYESSVAALSSEVARSPEPRAALVAAYLGVHAAATRHFGAVQAPGELAALFASIGFDPASVSAPIVGQIPGLAVHRDWIIVGTTSFDIDGTTRAQFHLDDIARVTTTSKQKGRNVVSTSVEAPRGGQLQIVSSGWSQTIRVEAWNVANARVLAETINIRGEQLKGSMDKAAQRSSVEVEQIRAIANPETAQALQNLQNLLFTRVISDEEFARMKSKLLADPTSAG